MPFLDEESLQRLSTTLGVSLNVGTKQTLYTVISGKSAEIVKVKIRNVSGAAVAADAGFGGDAGASDFRTDVQFSRLAAAGDGIDIEPFHGLEFSPVPGKVKTYAAGVAFGIKMGTLAAVTADIEVFGYLH